MPGDDGPGTKVPGGSPLRVEDEGFEPLVDFGFDAEGNLIEHVSSSHLQKTPATVPRPGLPSSSAASARVRKEHEEAQQQGAEVGSSGAT